MIGVVFSIIAGAAMSIQGVMNTRLGESVGTLHANAFVQVTAALLFAREQGFSALGQVNRLYLFGGALGLVITITVMLGIKSLSPTAAISIILISQLAVAAAIDALGLMGSERAAFTWTKCAGLALMVGGVLLIKCGK